MTDDLVRQLRIMTDALNVTMTETMADDIAENWFEFCLALIQQSRELHERIEELQNIKAKIQHANLRRDVNAKARTAEIDRLCKGEK